MTHRRALLAALACFFALPSASPAATTTVHLHYREDQESIIRCPARFECTIKLNAGETINKGTAADIPNWDPHVAYSGLTGRSDALEVRPFLLLRPIRSGLRSNVFVTTSQRAYAFLLISTNGNNPMHYVLHYPQVAAASAPAASPTPTPVTDLSDIPCKDAKYAFDDSPERRSHGDVPHSKFLPTLACNDGEHTYVQLQKFTELPSDLPVLSVVDNQHPGGVIANYVYDALHFRYVVDGVPDRLVLLYGSPKDRVLVRVNHEIGPVR